MNTVLVVRHCQRCKLTTLQAVYHAAFFAVAAMLNFAEPAKQTSIRRSGWINHELRIQTARDPTDWAYGKLLAHTLNCILTCSIVLARELATPGLYSAMFRS